MMSLTRRMRCGGGLIVALACLAGSHARAEAVAASDAETAFRNDCAAKFEAAEKAGSMTVAGSDGWLFMAKELRHISVGPFWGEDAVKVSRADKPQWADPLPVILDFKSQLDKAGIELLLVPVPPKAVVYPDGLGGGVSAGSQSPVVPRLDPAHRAFYATLAAKGVQVEDLTDAFIEARKERRGGQDLYCRTDSHWAPVACEIAARRIRDRFKAAAWMPSGKTPFTGTDSSITVAGDLAAAANGARETLAVRTVTRDGSQAGAASVDKASPVLLMGDSHCLVFHSGDDMLATGAGLVDQLALEMGMAIDLLGVRGSGATPARLNLMQRARSDTSYLAGKKLVIWCFTAREFTESQGWRKVPVVQ